MRESQVRAEYGSVSPNANEASSLSWMNHFEAPPVPVKTHFSGTPTFRNDPREGVRHDWVATGHRHKNVGRRRKPGFI
jgi:hypothetical protein